jgi:hypothetical protein
MSDTADYMDDSFVEIEVEGNPNFDDGIDVFFNEENEGTLGFDPMKSLILNLTIILQSI